MKKLDKDLSSRDWIRLRSQARSSELFHVQHFFNNTVKVVPVFFQHLRCFKAT